MKGICPNCEKETTLKFIKTKETINVRREPIEVDVEYYKCQTCKEEFEDPKSEHDSLDKAYREYRRRHSMLQPEEIRNLRKQYGLSQAEMSKLLGWGGATLSRYENGALQDETHEKALRLAMDPSNLRKLIEQCPDALSDEKRKKLLNKLKEMEKERYSFKHLYEERFGDYEADQLSGFKKLDLKKLFSAILFLCKGGALKTKLNKLLFYADFKHFQEYGVSITGARYARVPFGPAPDNYLYYFATLIEENSIEVKEIRYSDDAIGEEFITRKEPDLSLLSDSELKILASVKEHFRNYTAKRISDLSHEEKGWKETPNGQIISYEYANKLRY